jgi:capsular polysaccharide biosynthesis protein
MDRLAVDRGEGPGLAESVWRYRVLVALGVLLGVLGGWLLSTRQPVRYEAVTVLHLKDPIAGHLFQDEGLQADPNRYVRNQAAIITSPVVLDRAAKLADGRVTPKQLSRLVTSEPSKDSDLITVRVQDGTAQGAAQLADAVGRSYEGVVVKESKAEASRAIKQLQATATTLRRELASLEDRIRAAPRESALKAERVAVANNLTRVVERRAELEAESKGYDPVVRRVPAEPPEQPAQPQPLFLMAGGGLLGFAVAGGVSWRLSWRDWTWSERLAPRRVDGIDGNALEPRRWAFPQGRRVDDIAPMTSNGSGAHEDALRDQVTISDFETMATSVQQLFRSLDGPRQRLYEQNIPQLVAEEIAHRFPVDHVVVALSSGQEFQATGSVGLGRPQLHTSEHLGELIDEAMETGPRLLGDDERARLADDGLGVQTESLALVPIVHPPIGFGVLLAGRQNGSTERPAPLSDLEVEQIATTTRDVTDYLWAWLLIRNLKLRLDTLP